MAAGILMVVASESRAGRQLASPVRRACVASPGGRPGLAPGHDPLLTLPALLLAPFIGALCNSLPKCPVLVASALCGIGGSAGRLDRNTAVDCALVLVAVSFAIYGPMRFALIRREPSMPWLPLSRLNGLFETGSAVAVVAGFWLAAHFGDEVWQHFSIAALGVVGLHALAVLFARLFILPAMSDGRKRPLPPWLTSFATVNESGKNGKREAVSSAWPVREQ